MLPSLKMMFMWLQYVLLHLYATKKLHSTPFLLLLKFIHNILFNCFSLSTSHAAIYTFLQFSELDTVQRRPIQSATKSTAIIQKHMTLKKNQTNK